MDLFSLPSSCPGATGQSLFVQYPKRVPLDFGQILLPLLTYPVFGKIAKLPAQETDENRPTLHV